MISAVVSRFANVCDPIVKDALAQTWDAFAAKHREPLPSSIRKDALELWARAKFHNGHRNLESVHEITAVTLDVDEEPVPDACALIRDLFGVRAVCYSSSSATAKEDKWRVSIELSRPVDAAEYRRVSKAVAAMLSFPVGKASFDPARQWYVAREGVDGHFAWISIAGEPIDVDAMLAVATDTSAVPPAPVSTVRLASGEAAPANETNLRQAAAELLGRNWPPAGHRCDARLALAGACWRGQMTEAEAVEFLRSVHSHVVDRGDATDDVLNGIVQDAFAKGAASLPIMGWPSLASAGVSSAIIKAAQGLLNAYAEAQASFDLEMQAATPVESHTRPEIEVDTDLPRMVREGIAALSDTDMFQRAGRLVRVVRADGSPAAVIRCAGSPIIKSFGPATLKERLAAAASWFVFEKKGNVREVLPPGDVVATILERGEWRGIRPLVGICEAPVLRADGTVLQTSGYDMKTGFIYEPAERFPLVPDSPTLADAEAARDALLEIVVDFPFAGEPHRAAWLAALLTLFARPAIEGCTPFVAVDAPVRGTGKSLLTDTIALLTTGRSANRMPQPATDDEMRKRISALLREGENLVVLDNIARPIDYPALDAALTTTRWKDRILGVTETLSAPNHMVWISSGNNLVFGGDIIRRTLHIRLESDVENPERRGGFRHPDLLGWLRANRPALVVAALTILRGFFVAGQPRGGVLSWGSFEEWSRLVAAAVVWVGLPDPQSTRIDLDEADPERSDLVRLIDGLENALSRRALGADESERGLSAKELLGLADTDMREVFVELSKSTGKGVTISSHAVGNVLRRFRRRIVRGRRIDGAPDRKGVIRWWIETR